MYRYDKTATNNPSIVTIQFLTPPQTDKKVGVNAINRPRVMSTILIFFMVNSIAKLINSSNNIIFQNKDLQ